LALYEAAIDRLERAEATLQAGDEPAASDLVARSLMLVSGLAAGLDMSHGDLPRNLLRIYEYITRLLHPFTLASVREALSLLRILRVGFDSICDNVIEAERNGTIPPVDEGPIVIATA
jgi:flagellin-specific chaperone FliS